MVAIISRRTEEEIIKLGNNTCIMQENCCYVVDLGLPFAGSAVEFIGSPQCILCHRRKATADFDCGVRNAVLNPYNNIETEYVEQDFIDVVRHVGIYNGFTGPFVRYRKGDYIVTTDMEVNQTLNIPKNVDNWLTNMYNIKLNRVSEFSMWSICICPNALCKAGLFSFKEVQKATGISGTCLNLSDGAVYCYKCHERVAYLNANPLGLVLLGDTVLSRCEFCKTVVDFDSSTAVQSCKTCMAYNLKQSAVMQRKCHKCNSNVNRIKNLQTITVRRQENGEIFEIYLCKQHRVFSPSDRIMDELEVQNMLSPTMSYK